MNRLEYGKYYYCKKTNETMRYDGWAMQSWSVSGDRVWWLDGPPLEDLEEVTWGTKAIPIQDFSGCEHY